MVHYDVDRILEVFNSRSWAKYYDIQDVKDFKRNIWFNISKVDKFSFVREIINSDLEKIKPGLSVSGWITFLIYNVGDFFNEHVDGNSYSSSTSNTLYSGGYLLNKDYEGGEFVVDGKPLDVDIGELFYFGRDTRHRVKEVTKGIRYSLHFAIDSDSADDKRNII